MTFTISIKAPYIEIDAFYPYSGWDEKPTDKDGTPLEDEDGDALRAFIERCIAASPDDESEMEELWEVIDDPAEDYLSCVGTAWYACNASIDIDEHPDGDFRWDSRKSWEIDNPFSDYEKYEVPEIEELIPEIVKSKFCFLKVWENSGGLVFKAEGQFDLSKLTWEKGEFFYDGQEFDFTDGDGSSSYTAFYKDGEEV